MILALDFDKTFTALPQQWIIFLRNLPKGWEVLIVTARQFGDSHPWLNKLIDTNLALDILYCDGQAKKDVVEIFGYKVDIWIDDDPMNIIISRTAGEKWEGYIFWREYDLKEQSKLPELDWSAVRF